MIRKRYDCFGIKKDRGKWTCTVLNNTECAHGPCPFYQNRDKYRHNRKRYRQKELEYLRERRVKGYE